MLGVANAGGADGVIGISNAGGLGVGGATDSPQQAGILALNTSDTGTATGLRAESHSSGDGSTAVHGTATSSSGVTYGVTGTANSPDGYGLATPDDAKVDGVAELTTLGGSLTDGTEITNIAGDNLTIDVGGDLNASGGPTYKTNTLESTGTTWDAITGLSEKTPVEVTVDTHEVTSGIVKVDVDGSTVGETGTDNILHRIVGATSDMALTARDADDISGAGLVRSYDLSGSDPGPTDVTFRSDGTKMFTSDDNTTEIQSYDISTAWDLSTASFNTSFSVSNYIVTASGLAVTDNATRLYVCGHYYGDIFSYSLYFNGTAYVSVETE